MSKRKADEKAVSSTKMDVDDEGSSSDEDLDLIDVDFEWFDLDIEIDFHGIKALWRQLLDVDHQLTDISALTNLLLMDPTIGSTVKCDGKDSDPFALVTLLDLTRHEGDPAVQSLKSYLTSKGTTSSGALNSLPDLLSKGSNSHVGLIVSERLINMPHQIVPPLYSMLAEEIQTAQTEGGGKEFSHFIILSKVYTEVTSQLDAQDSRPQKKNKAAGSQKAELFYFHAEDEVLHKYASDVITFEYTNQGGDGASDSKRTFQELGIRPQGHLMLLEAKKLQPAAKAIAEYLAGQP